VTVLVVALGAAIGAPLRYIADRTLQGRHDSRFPWGTFFVNVCGSALLGFLSALPWLSQEWLAFFGTGLCGALTTYSTFSFETVTLARSGARTLAALYVAASVLAGFGAAYCGLAFAQALR
jgi:CrcB protein